MEHFLESLKKLKKPSVHSNPEDVDPLFCRYNKGWNGEYFTDGFEKLKVIAWMPLPAMPKPYKENKHE